MEEHVCIGIKRSIVGCLSFVQKITTGNRIMATCKFINRSTVLDPFLKQHADEVPPFIDDLVLKICSFKGIVSTLLGQACGKAKRRSVSNITVKLVNVRPS